MSLWHTELLRLFPELEERERELEALFPGITAEHDLGDSLLALNHRVWLPALDANDGAAIRDVIGFWDFLVTADEIPPAELYTCLETIFFDLVRKRRETVYSYLTHEQLQSMLPTLWYSRVNREAETFDPEAEYHRARGRLN